MSAEGTSRRARWFVGAGAVFLVAWGVADLAGAGRRVGIVLGLYGVVLHTVFGKAYSLVPSYFDRELSTPRASTVQFPLSALGTAALAVGAYGPGPDLLGTVGAALWLLGVTVFVGAIAWSVRDNLAGAETGTGEHNAGSRRSVQLSRSPPSERSGRDSRSSGPYSTRDCSSACSATGTGDPWSRR